PDGADLSLNWLARAFDFAMGVLDTLTGGLTKRLERWAGLDGAVNDQSSSYQWGSYAGEAALIVLVAGGAEGTLVTAMWGAQGAEGVINGVEEMMQGNYKAG